MRFVLAIVSFVLAAILIGFGIAQRTILASPDEVALGTTVSSPATVTVIEGDTLNAFAGSQTLNISGSDTVFAAYGRTTDVLAWIGDTTYNLVSIDPETGELVSSVVKGAETDIPDPNGSDLWYDDFVKDDKLALTVKVPADVSFIIASDGTAPAPSTISLSWPLDNSTPWSGPLIVAGAVMLLLGLGFLLWATNHMRSTRGPRRKSTKLPKVPRKQVFKPRRKPLAKPAAEPAPELETSTTQRRALGALPVVLVGALILAGCSATPSPATPDALPSPSGSAAGALSELDPPAVTVRQVERIVEQVSAVATAADAAGDTAAIATRFEGPALELRLANYAIRVGDPAQAALAAIPAGPVKVTLPQQTDTWPRTVFAVIQDDKDATIPPVALFLVQEDPRSQYKVSYAITMEPSAVLPDVAPASVGAARLAADSGVLKFTPTEVALAYGDILELDVESSSYLDFEADGDSLRASVGLAKKNEIRAALPTTASISFTHTIGAGEPISLATNDSGAIVAVNLDEMTTVTPVEAGAAINPSGQVKALSGVAISTKGVVATYGDQLLFYVPPAGSADKIVLLGYSQGLVKASEIG